MASRATSRAAEASRTTASRTPRVKAKKVSLSKRQLARQQVVLKYTPYVRSIAGKVKKGIAPEIDFEDLVEYGMIGLLEASDRYDPSHGANFMTFAYYRIRGAIYDGLRGMGWMSRSEYARARFEERTNQYLAQLEEEHADLEDVAPEIAAEKLSSIVQSLAVVFITSLDAAEGLQIKDTVNPSQEERLGLEEARKLVRETIGKLNEQERVLLEMYYYKDRSLQEVGETLGLSKSWTSRLHARVLEKLQRILGSLDAS
jgi:RNA polymerase sigma factor FliA